MSAGDRSPSLAHAPHLTRRPARAWDGDPVPAWQRGLRRALVRATGLDRMPSLDAVPRARSLGNLGHPLGTVSKLELTMEPGAIAPAYLCLPRGAAPERILICLQGHGTTMRESIGRAEDERTPVDVEGERDFAQACLRRGLGALALEQRCFGERAERRQARRSFHNPCHDAAMRALLIGRTLLGERVFDVLRAAAWLRRRFPGAAIGVLGHSGGGTVGLMAAALDPGIGPAIVSGSFCTVAASIASIHHCSDNYVPGMLLVADQPDVAGLIAPRPLVIVAGREDPIFPLPGVKRAFTRLRRIYRAAGAGDRVRLVVGDLGHRFYAAEAFAALERVSDPW